MDGRFGRSLVFRLSRWEDSSFSHGPELFQARAIVVHVDEAKRDAVS